MEFSGNIVNASEEFKTIFEKFVKDQKLKLSQQKFSKVTLV